jgi:hypothetical protein
MASRTNLCQRTLLNPEAACDRARQQVLAPPSKVASYVLFMLNRAGRTIDRARIAIVVLGIPVVLSLPLYWLHEPSRQAEVVSGSVEVRW